MTPLNFGVVGLGTHGTRYANHLLKDVPDGRLISVSRRNEELGKAYADEKGVKFFADYNEQLDDSDLDVAVVVTDPSVHLPVAKAAAQRGKHVLVEKPMARTAAEAQAIIEACDEAGVRLMVSQTMRYNPIIAELRNRKDGLGKLVGMTICQRQEPAKLAWQHSLDLSGGGSILESGVHFFDAIRWITGDEAAEAYCVADRLGGRETEDLFVAIVTMRSGARCTIDACKYTQSRYARIELLGETGQLVASMSENRISEIRGREITPLESPAPVQGLPMVAEAFASAILNNTDVPITGEDGMKTVAIADACYKSVEEGRPVEVG